MKKDKLYEKIREALQTNPMAFIEYEVYSCQKCRGTGLKGAKYLYSEGGFSWLGEECEGCKGLGVIPEENLNEHIYEILESFFCSRCDGKGCSKCDNTGFVDWITHARGG